MPEKVFTVQEAEALIPKLEQIVEGLMDHKRNAMEIGQQLSRIQEQLKAGDKTVEATALPNKQTELEFLVKIINEGLDAIEELGAEPKDLDLGLVDFPTIINGEEVLLCWKYGEKSITHYHGLRDGFAGRKRIQNG